MIEQQQVKHYAHVVSLKGLQKRKMEKTKYKVFNYLILFICILMVLDAGSTWFSITNYPTIFYEIQPVSVYLFNIFGVTLSLIMTFTLGTLIILGAGYVMKKALQNLEKREKDNLYFYIVTFGSLIFIMLLKGYVVISNFRLLFKFFFS